MALRFPDGAEVFDGDPVGEWPPLRGLSFAACLLPSGHAKGGAGHR